MHIRGTQLLLIFGISACIGGDDKITYNPDSPSDVQGTSDDSDAEHDPVTDAGEGEGEGEGEDVDTGGSSTDQDPDDDGLTNAEEAELGTDPNSSDTDDDGLNDGVEVTQGTDPLDADSDNDGVSDGAEVRASTNPLNPDSDGDGWTDGEESTTDPLDASDHPYLGGWETDACRDTTEATGNDVGEIAEDFALYDQYGETVRLHAFCDHAVLIISTAMWSSSALSDSAWLQSLYESYADQGLIVLLLLSEDLTGDPPDTAELSAWADDSGLSFPVLNDGEWKVGGRYEQDGAIPSMTLLAPGGTIVSLDSDVDASDIEAVLR